nr:MAG TPA: hypothetical protein [Caudoviricetes sp.]
MLPPTRCVRCARLKENLHQRKRYIISCPCPRAELMREKT